MIVDDALPELEHLTTPEGASQALAAFGFSPPVDISVLAHRKGRRAVVKLGHADGDVFCKLMQPEVAQPLAQHHRMLRKAGLPVPRVIGYTDGGALFIATSEGMPGPDAALAHEPSVILDAVDRLRAQFATAGLQVKARASVATRIDWFIEQLQIALPQLADELADLMLELGPVQYASTSRLEGIHGDLHIGQLFFDGGEVSGVIDVDTAGLGEPDTDAANFIAHAIASALINDEAGNASAAQALGLLADAADRRWIHSSRARALTAVHLIGHAHRAVMAENAGRALKLIDMAKKAARARG